MNEYTTTRDTISAGRHYLLATAGSCPGSKGTGGWGFLLMLIDGKEEPRQFPYAKQVLMWATNNSMDLVAAINGLQRLREPETPVIVQSASGYLVSGMNEWMPSWRMNNFKAGKLKNSELWQRLDQFNQARSIIWEKTVNLDAYLNVACADRMARLAVDGRNVQDNGVLNEAKRLQLEAGELERG
ncbi:MAG: RNase H family protein [Devosia sp.]